jgi:hypothetical protein
VSSGPARGSAEGAAHVKSPVPTTLGEAFGRLLDTAEGASPLDAVEAVTRELGELLGASGVSFLIADLSGRALVRLVGASTEVLPFDGGPAEQTLRTQTTRVLKPGDGPRAAPPGHWTVLAPMTERGESLGLLEMFLPQEPPPDVVREIARTAHLLSFVVIANRRHTDIFEGGQRSSPFTLRAEIQRRLLPAAFTCEAGSFTLSGWLGQRPTSVGTPSTTASTPMCCIYPSRTRWATAWPAP